MHYTCWPIGHTVYNTLRIRCLCGDFESGYGLEDAVRQDYREHVAAVVKREANRWHQEPT